MRYNASDGSFEIQNLPSGAYVITATVRQPGQGVRGGPSPASSIASARVTLTSSDVDNIQIRTKPIQLLSGRIELENEDVSALKGVVLPRISLIPDDSLVRGAQAAVNQDGTFRVELAAGSYKVRMASVPAPFYIKRVTFERDDVLNTSLQFSETSTGPLEIIFGRSAGLVKGTIRNDKGQALANASVVLVPDNPNLQSRSDLFRVVTTDTSGRFTISGVAPGLYKVFGWQELESYWYFDSDLINRFVANSKSVRVSLSDSVEIDLQAISGRLD
jgi:hypothetical protein